MLDNLRNNFIGCGHHTRDPHMDKWSWSEKFSNTACQPDKAKWIPIGHLANSRDPYMSMQL